MPKTPVDEYRELRPSEDYVRSAGQIAPAYPKAEPSPMKGGSKGHFGLGIPTLHRLHASTCSRGDRIHIKRGLADRLQQVAA